MDQLWLAAARQCGLHSASCSLHHTQHRRKGSGKLVQPKARAAAADGSSENKGDHHHDLAEEMLKLDPVTQARLRKVGEAAALVANLQAQQADLAQQILEAQQASAADNALQERDQAQRASERGAEADVLAAQEALLDAKRDLEAARRDVDVLIAARNQDAERIESAKAGVAAAMGGLLGSLPFLAVQGHDAASALLSAAQVFASCLLFGVTFRYVHHADPRNAQLKLGTVAAFGLVRGLAYADAAQVSASTAGGSPLDAAVVGASSLAAGESMLTFGFAAAALEFALERGLVKRFGSALEQD